MSKKSKKRSRKRSYSSPSSEDDEKRRKKRKVKEDRQKREDRYEDKNKHVSREAASRPTVCEKSRGRELKKAVYRHSKSTSKEYIGKKERNSKSKNKSQSDHRTSSNKEKPADVSKSKGQSSSASTSALMVPLKKDRESLHFKFLEKSHKKAEKEHVRAPPKDTKYQPIIKTLSIKEQTERDSLKSHSLVEDTKPRTTLSKNIFSGPMHKSSRSYRPREKASDLNSPQKTQESESTEDPVSPASAGVSEILRTSASIKEKISDSKEPTKRIERLHKERVSTHAEKTSVSSAHVSSNFTINNWVSVPSPHKSPEERVLAEPPKTAVICKNASSTSTPKLWMPSSVSAAEKMDEKQRCARPPSHSRGTKSASQTLVEKPSAPSDPNSDSRCHQAQVAEELYLARTEKRLEVNVCESYGELTCMDIDSPQECATETHNKQLPEQDLILILDTNILLSHLDYVKRVIFHGLEGLGHPIVLIPWVVLQELDSLKIGRGLAGSVSHLACPAISYIHNSLKNREPRLWGQSMQQAAEINDGLNAENNDDRVLQCCLQYQTLYPGCALILCTNDKNLCCKALLSGVKAFTKTDLEAESRSRLQISHTPQIIVSSSTTATTTPLRRSSKSPTADTNGPEVGDVEEEKKIKCISELESCLKDVLADVLEKEMKAVYDELWLEIVFRKPPWTLTDVLQCFKKHWIAVFGGLVSRNLLDNVKHLLEFFTSGKSSPALILTSIYQAKELVKAFKSRCSLVGTALSEMDNMVNLCKDKTVGSVKPGEGSLDDDVIMNDVGDYREVALPQVSYQEVWQMFENIWTNVCQLSLEVFKALRFDPNSMQSGLTAGGPMPPQDALACLTKLSSMISQLLEAFSRVLSSAPGEDEVQNLLLVIRSNGISEEISRLSEKDLVECFSKQEYREKLCIGGTQLLKLKETLEACRVSTALVCSHEGSFVSEDMNQHC